MTSWHAGVRSGLVVMLFGFSGMLFSPNASAQEGVFTKDFKWGLVRVGNCKFVMHAGSRPEVNSEGKDISYTWSGPCDSEGLIEGQGVLTVDFWVPPPEGDYPSGLFGDSLKDNGPAKPTKFRIKTSGTATGGMFEGMASIATLSDADDRDDSTPPGSMQLVRPNSWAVDKRNPRPAFFKNGCTYSVSANGVVDESYTWSLCEPQGAQRLLELLKAGKNSELVRVEP